MKTSYILRKSMVAIVLAFSTVMFAMFPDKPAKHSESKAERLEMSNQTSIEDKGETMSQAFSYSLGKAMLVREEGVMDKNARFSINGIDEDNLPPLNMGMVNVTGEHGGFRMLPHGTRFSKDITIVLPYDSLLIPVGYSAADIHTIGWESRRDSHPMVCCVKSESFH